MVSSAAPGVSLIPGMSVEDQDDNGKQTPFKSWEEWESGGRLENVFSWKVPKCPKLSDAEKAERRRFQKELKSSLTDGAEAVGEAKEGAAMKNQNNKVEIPDSVRKILLRRKKGSKNSATKKGVNEFTVVKEKRNRAAREMPSEIAVKRKSVKEAEKKEKAAERKKKAAEKKKKAAEQMVSTLVDDHVFSLVDGAEMEKKLEQKLDQAQGKEEESVSRLDRSGWPKNPVPNYGGSPGSVDDRPGVETFKYKHPNTSYTVDLKGEQCPGCGEEKKQLVQNLKTDKKCSINFEGKIDFESFDEQLKQSRTKRADRRSKARRKQEKSTTDMGTTIELHRSAIRRFHPPGCQRMSTKDRRGRVLRDLMLLLEAVKIRRETQQVKKTNWHCHCQCNFFHPIPVQLYKLKVPISSGNIQVILVVLPGGYFLFSGQNR